MSAHGEMGLKQALLAASAPALIQKAVVDGDIERGVMATGVIAGRITDLPSCEMLIERIVLEARGRLRALGPPQIAEQGAD
jgi:NAD(P)H-dependent flavin oxidoreductase YrpB (nitropropane dioxygenase family)